MISTATTKTCYTCGQQLPSDHFGHRNRGSDGRKGRCRACDAAYMRAYRRRRQAKRLDRFAGELAREKSLNRAAALCGRMMSDFGGVDRFAKLWKAHIDHAASVQPGSACVLRACGAVVKLIEVAGRQKPDYSTWTDADLAEFERLLAGR